MKLNKGSKGVVSFEKVVASVTYRLKSHGKSCIV
jgi:hypothetical protein